MKNRFILFISLLIFNSCQYSLGDYDPEKVEVLLSVEAQLDNLAEVRRIRIFKTTPGLTNKYISEPQMNATVFVIEDDKKKTQYFPKKGEFGVYETASEFAGIPGRTYQLQIELENGTKIESLPQKMPLVTKITSLKYETTVDSKLGLTNPFRGGYDVYLTTKDGPEKNYYRWEWVNYKRLLFCNYCQQQVRNGGSFYQCDEQAVGLDPSGNIDHYKCGGPECFRITKGTEYNVLNDEVVNGKEINDLKIARIPYSYESNTFPVNSYYLQVRQRSLTREAYFFYKDIAKINDAGTMFDVPSLTRTNINLSSSTDKNLKIIGIFDVNSVDIKAINVEMTDEIPNAKKIIRTIRSTDACPISPCPVGCFESDTRTSKRPIGWIE